MVAGGRAGELSTLLRRWMQSPAARGNFHGDVLHQSQTRRKACRRCSILLTVADHLLFLVLMVMLLVAELGHAAEEYENEQASQIRRSLIWTLPLSVLSCATRGIQRFETLPPILVGPVPLLHVSQIVAYSYFREMSGPVFLEIVEGLMLGVILGTEGVIFFSSYFPELPPAMGGVPPADKPVVPVERFTTDAERGACTICLDEMRCGEQCSRLPCGHVFHSGCLDKWIESHGHSPFCPYRCADEASATDQCVVPAGTGSVNPTFSV
mmetsp:Transcript_6859/g.12086  ORF Transcript_6859/g.12086 Transcript_6859/m.12086 type:complete len:267 (+) Transcript_6859:63-863(+)